MIRPIASFTCVAGLVAALCACDNPGVTEQQKEMKANQQAANAQAAADKDRAGAQLDFEKTREDYRHMRRQELSDLDKKIVDIEANERTATGKQKADFDQRLPVIRAQRDAFVRHMQELDTATGATWDATKASLDKEWDSVTATVDSAPHSR
jgi:hypothetical protein